MNGVHTLSLYKAQELQVVLQGNVCEVMEVRTLLVITQVNSGLIPYPHL